MDSTEFKKAVVLDKKTKRIIQDMEQNNRPSTSSQTGRNKRSAPAQEESYDMNDDDSMSFGDRSPLKRQRIIQIVNQYCYPTLIVVPVLTSIILILFSSITVVIKMFTIALLLLSLFIYYTQNLKPLSCKMSNRQGQSGQNPTPPPTKTI